MLVLKIFLTSILAFGFESHVEVKRTGEFKVFKTIVTASFDASMESVVKGIENFDDKCNNERRSKRKYFDWKKNCSFHNENLVEAVKIHNFKKIPALNKIKGVQYLMWRNIYNRGKFSHYDVITKVEEKNTVTIKHMMLKEEIVKESLLNPEKINSAFEDIQGEYKITKLSKNKVKVVYTYESKTDHWFLTKDFLESNIKKNMAEGTIQAVKSIGYSLKSIKGSL